MKNGNINAIVAFDALPPEYVHQRWRRVAEIVDFSYDYYLITDHGLVWNRCRNRFMALTNTSSGYLSASLSGPFGPKTTPIHRLVALAFIHNDDPNNKTSVNHIDGNKSNNYYKNLEWVTPRENTIHAYSIGLLTQDMSAKTSIEDRDRVRELLAMHKYSCREISEITGISKSIVSHIRYSESWSNENNKYDYNIRNTFTIDDIENLCKYFEINKKEYSPSYMREALQYINLGTDANWCKMASNIYFRKTYTNISSKYNF